MLRLLALAVACSAAFAGLADAQAYCALRDPNRQIFDLFPEADSYRSLVRTVDETTRRDVGERLPFSLHFNELGRHTVYVAQREGRPLGVVHARSEAGRWGLVEVAWAFDVDLRVRGFAFQRCRDRSKSHLQTEGVRRALVGTGFEELRELLAADGKSLAPKALPIPETAAPLGAALVRCALKTIAATESAWGEDLWNLRARELACAELPGAHRLVALGELYDDTTLADLDAAVGARGVGVQRDASRAWDVFDEEGAWLARLMISSWRHAPYALEVWWLLDSAGRISRVDAHGKWPDMKVRETFQQQLDKDRAALGDCAGAVELFALEVLVTLDRPAPE